MFSFGVVLLMIHMFKVKWVCNTHVQVIHCILKLETVLGMFLGVCFSFQNAYCDINKEWCIQKQKVAFG